MRNIFLIFIIIFSVSRNCYSAIPEKELLKDFKTCNSSKEFQSAYEFLKQDKDLELNDLALIRTAIVIAKGCDDAFLRFKKSYLSMKKSGVDIRKSLEIGISFSELSNQQTENFYVIFQKSFLENYFDFDFLTAYHLSLKLSTASPDYIYKIREDFVEFVNFCLDQKQVGLPIKECGKITEKVIDYSQYFKEDGVFKSFRSIYDFLKTHQRIGLSTRDAVNVALNVIKFGPTAVSNFKETFTYSIEKIKSPITENQALQLSQEISELSIKMIPPVSTIK